MSDLEEQKAKEFYSKQAQRGVPRQEQCPECKQIAKRHTIDCSIGISIGYRGAVYEEALLDGKTFPKRLDVLIEREKEYGSFKTIAMVAAKLKDAMTRTQGQGFSSIEQEAIQMICTKLARISQNPSHKDSWKDIIGYATLVLEELDF